MALLEVKNLTKNFGGLTAVGDVTMELNEGELVGLIGPNGAGKTTLFNLLTGVYEPSEGTITLDGHLLNGKAPYKIAAGGLGRTFQNIRLFKDLSVLDNVLIAFANHHKPHVFASLFRLPSYYKNEEALKAKALELLAISVWKKKQILWLKTWLTDNNVTWRSFVPLLQSQKSSSWMNLLQG